MVILRQWNSSGTVHIGAGGASGTPTANAAKAEIPVGEETKCVVAAVEDDRGDGGSESDGDGGGATAENAFSDWAMRDLQSTARLLRRAWGDLLESTTVCLDPARRRPRRKLAVGEPFVVDEVVQEHVLAQGVSGYVSAPAAAPSGADHHVWC